MTDSLTGKYSKVRRRLSLEPRMYSSELCQPRQSSECC